ncbi:MAG: hypothetical protein Q8770_02755 [Sweet potato little leaf phytoplasma]|nr:hypothetical protein [Sweet potato little leaf phytoplasma]
MNTKIQRQTPPRREVETMRFEERWEVGFNSEIEIGREMDDERRNDGKRRMRIVKEG